MSPLRQRLSLLLSVLSILALVAGGFGWYGWQQLRASLPLLDGEHALAGLAAPVILTRDALGTPTINGTTRLDVARATGFVHAQDRFFQMDLLRRRGSGELAELFGPAAVASDQATRVHRFRPLAQKVFAQLSPSERELLTAYTAGVNTGLAALARSPWEYLLLNTPPRAWREEDSLLCIYAMWLDLQDSTASYEQNREALRQSLGKEALDFLAPRGNSWDAALDDSKFPAAPLPTWRLARPETDSKKTSAAPSAREPGSQAPHGSNAFAVAGRHTASGAALLANDIHLDLGVPPIWYRAALQWTDDHGPHRIVGVMLPGTPLIVAGSNGRVAWGFTAAYCDTTDLIRAEPDGIANIKYRTKDGYEMIEDFEETIAVKGEESVKHPVRWTGWGPIIGELSDNRYPVLHWTAHDPAATNLRLLEMETTATVTDAVAVAHRAGMPNQNLLAADADGRIAWTVSGLVPRRFGYDGRLAAAWAYGDRRWDGWLSPEEIPALLEPAEGLLWNGNNRPLGDKAFTLLGDNGYDEGARAGQIRDDLRALLAQHQPATPADLRAVQLDDRTLFLDRWQQLLLSVLTDEAVHKKSDRAKLRAIVAQWEGHAAIDSAAYRIVRAFRLHTAERAFAPFAGPARRFYADFSYANFPYEDALWQLVQEQPARLLNPEHTSWQTLLLAATDDVLAEADEAGVTLAKFTWGRRNTLAMQHPISRRLPGWLAQFLDMPAEPIAGDDNMPRVQGRSFGQSLRLVVAPGHEDEGFLDLPGGQSGHPLSPWYRASHAAWAKGGPTPLLPGPAQHSLTLKPE